MQYLRWLIVAADLAGRTVAARVNTSTATLAKVLSGDRLPQRSTVEAIASLCGVSEEVRARLLRLHTAALGEVNRRFADRLAPADAYGETVLVHEQLQAAGKP
ncbi:helix-turn-helix domain-containing protein [Streptomyces sp. NPDC059979]|uniref:helix-turn-helix domain-containing protein n=1 Tax=Streptomyces sp. NPDC059979 TaxID=3347021 RepID=UPI00368B1861